MILTEEEHNEKRYELTCNFVVILKAILECRQLYRDLSNDDDSYKYLKTEDILIELKDKTMELLTELMS